MGWTDDLLTGFAQLLAARGVGTYRPAGQPYRPTDRAPIFLAAMPGDPDEVIVLTAYSVRDDTRFAQTVEGLQVRTRGLPHADSHDLDDAVFDVLHDLEQVTLPTGVRVALVQRQNSTPLGIDSHDRHERASNFYVTAHRPGPNRL